MKVAEGNVVEGKVAEWKLEENVEEENVVERKVEEQILEKKVRFAPAECWYVALADEQLWPELTWIYGDCAAGAQEHLQLLEK